MKGARPSLGNEGHVREGQHHRPRGSPLAIQSSVLPGSLPAETPLRPCLSSTFMSSGCRKRKPEQEGDRIDFCQGHVTHKPGHSQEVQ